MFGIAFGKLMTMLLYRMTGFNQSVPFTISLTGCRHTLVLFGCIYAVTLFYNFMQIKLSNPMELLHSANTGEREPKTKVLLAVIGAAALGGGYYLALTVADAVSAITMFFVAVLLVILGTYCLFTAGSIAVLKLLRKNKNYYYKSRHFSTVSGMISPDETERGGTCQYLYSVDDGSGDGFYHPVYVSGSGRRPKTAFCT